jgi:hypothetical protein
LIYADRPTSVWLFTAIGIYQIHPHNCQAGISATAQLAKNEMPFGITFAMS